MAITLIDMREALARLLPPGPLATDTDSNLGRLMYPMASELWLLYFFAALVVIDLPPKTATTFLEDWERCLGLPKCGGVLPATLQDRQALVLAHLTQPRNLTLATIQAVLATAGWTATVTESAVTDHQFEVDVPSLEITYFRAGVSAAGERLASFGIDGLDCLISKIKPAHTTYVLTTPP